MRNTLFTSCALLCVSFCGGAAHADYIVTYEKQTVSKAAADLMTSFSPAQAQDLHRKLKDPLVAFVFGHKVRSTIYLKGAREREDLGSAHMICDGATGSKTTFDDTSRSYLELTRAEQDEIRNDDVDADAVAFRKAAVVTPIGTERSIAGHPAVGYRVAAPGNARHTFEVWIAKDIPVSTPTIGFETDPLPASAAALNNSLVLAVTERIPTDRYVTTFTETAVSVVEKPVPDDLFQVPGGYRRQDDRAQVNQARETKADFDEMKRGK